MEHLRNLPTGGSFYSSSHLRVGEKPYLHRIQSCTAEEDESDIIEKNPEFLVPSPISELIVNKSATEINTTPNAPRRIYKSRLHRSVTISTGEANDADNMMQPMTPSPHKPGAAQFRSRGALPRTRWSSRVAKIKSLQRSRTIDTRGNTVQWNPGSLLISPDADGKSVECHPLHESIENLQKWSLKEGDQFAHLFKHSNRNLNASATKKGYLDVGTQYYSPSASVDADQISNVEMSTVNRKPKVSINVIDTTHCTGQADEVGRESVEITKQTDAQIPLNAAAMADGLVEEVCDPSKQSTSSYLKEQFFAFFQPSDNKLAMKLFGSKSALNKEKRRQQQHGKWIIHPCSSFR